jgi:nitrite reductase/ring-hydroxylating ferredoxin subunit
MMPQAPPSSRYATYPTSWYLLGRSSELRRRPVSKTILGRELVAFRTQGGWAVVMDGRCAHMGADLGGGCVSGETLRCPFHGWEYGADGRCTHIPGTCDAIPRFARQTAYPVEERHGFVFFFNGPEPLFPLPFFFDVRPEELSAGIPFRFIARCTWYLFASHAFDVQHFATVHDRQLVGPPVIDCPAPFARRNRYTARVSGTNIYDRMLRRFAGRQVDISITTWGGTLFYLTGNFGRALSRFLIAARPLEDGTTLAEGIVFKPRGGNLLTRALFDPLGLWVRRLFTSGYLRDEASRLGHPHYNPATMIHTDKDMIDFFHWVVDLPQDAAELRTSRDRNGDHDGTDAPNRHTVENGALALEESS